MTAPDDPHEPDATSAIGDHNDPLPIGWNPDLLAIERAYGAIIASGTAGWSWLGKPDPNQPDELLGTRQQDCHEDGVLIDLKVNPPSATGFRYSRSQLGQQNANPLRGPISGSPDEIIFTVMNWPEQEET